MSQNLQNFVKFQKFQLDNLVDFEKCCKTHIYLQKSVPIQPKTSNILLKFCQKLATFLAILPKIGKNCHFAEILPIIRNSHNQPSAERRPRGRRKLCPYDGTNFTSHKFVKITILN